MRAIVPLLAGSLVLSGCAGADGREQPRASGISIPAAGGSGGPTACPVTVPPRPGSVPPEPYPPEPPFGQVWYGTRDLWTLLDPEPVIWRLGALPVREGRVGDKTLWFSETFSTSEGEDFSGDPSITLTATRLDAPAPVVEVDHGVPSFNEHTLNFLVVPLRLPAEPGCWRVTATYHGVELSYVLEVR